MSNFNCEKCGTTIIDKPNIGFVSFCRHYPRIKKEDDNGIDITNGIPLKQLFSLLRKNVNVESFSIN